MLQRFAEEIWTAEGPTASVAGFEYPTRMIVIRLSDRSLFVWSPVAITHDLQVAVDQLGKVAHIVAPNTLHHIHIADWHRSYPDARIHAVPELRTKLSELRWDSDLSAVPDTGWADDVDQVVVPGNRITTEVVFFHRRSRTVIFADLIQQFEPGWFKGWRALVARLDLMTAQKATVPRKFRIAFRDRNAARTALRRILEWPAEAVLAAHAAPIRRDGRDAIAHAFNWMRRL